jgi:cell wall-associated NlpC family hydrolase
MFVLDGAKARLAALAMTAVTAIPLLPKAHAHVEEPKVSSAQAVELKAPKKTKKKAKTTAKTEHKPRKAAPAKTKPVIAWGPRPVEHPLAIVPKKGDPLKVVLAVAKKQLGKPYRYGAVGPSSFDCSGFTMFVWKHAGVSLPHNSAAQYNALPHVSRDKARLGDLVYSPGHIGLYIGDGKMIHSPQTGDTVEISPIHDNITGFARPKA